MKDNESAVLFDCIIILIFRDADPLNPFDASPNLIKKFFRFYDKTFSLFTENFWPNGAIFYLIPPCDSRAAVHTR